MKLRNYFGSLKASAKQFDRRKVSGSIGDLFLRILPNIYVKISFENSREVRNVFMYLDYLIPETWPSKQASR